MTLRKLLTTTAITAAASMAIFGGSANAAKYIIIANGNSLPAEIYSQVGSSGGILQKNYSFGVGVAESSDPAFADKLLNVANVKDVILDVGFDVQAVKTVEGEFGFPPNSGDNDIRFDLQWGHNYVGAQQSWENGHRGQDVVVAVLDGGFDTDHPDLAPNIIGVADMTGQGAEYNDNCPGDPFSHGTHVAGTVAAADNGFGVIGVAPEASLLLVKVLRDNPDDNPNTPALECSGGGSFADVIAGIYYATDHGADVINMSLGTLVPRQGIGGGPDGNAGLSALANAVDKAITYAYQNGTTVIVSAGNDAHDLDGDGGVVRFNTGMSHAVGVSALAPENWAGNNGNVGLDPASYTNYGTSMVDFSAPGGDFDYPGNELCTVGGLTRPCWVFDLVFSDANGGGGYWSAGTSMASPHAAGVAALIISETGDSDPAHVIREMRRRSIDAGKKGRDDFYGHGIANTGN
ncbi:MAG: S8 family serine peptidase [Parvularculaceae bacterium]